MRVLSQSMAGNGRATDTAVILIKIRTRAMVSALHPRLVCVFRGAPAPPSVDVGHDKVSDVLARQRRRGTTVLDEPTLSILRACPFD